MNAHFDYEVDECRLDDDKIGAIVDDDSVDSMASRDSD